MAVTTTRASRAGRRRSSQASPGATSPAVTFTATPSPSGTPAQATSPATANAIASVSRCMPAASW
nr:hypothetical protein [Actinomycetales bacterium]